MQPTITLKLPKARKLRGVQFLSDPYLAASRPKEVAVRLNGGEPVTLTVDREGFITFPDQSVLAGSLELKFTATEDVVDVVLLWWREEDGDLVDGRAGRESGQGNRCHRPAGGL